VIALLLGGGGAQMNVMRARAGSRFLEKWVDKIERPKWNVLVAKARKKSEIRVHWLKRSHGNLNIDDRLRREAGDRSGTDVFNAKRELAQGRTNARRLRGKPHRPRRIVRNDRSHVRGKCRLTKQANRRRADGAPAPPARRPG
jgi:hypothetical protein